VIKYHTLLGTSLLLGTFFISGCSVNEPQPLKEAIPKSELSKQQKVQDPVKSFSDLKVKRNSREK
jgi:PBP1b-binding outer membrane lipoprotein LpoB